MSTDTIHIPFDVRRCGDSAISMYLYCICRGESPMMAEMLACRTAPGANTEREFFAGRHTLEQQFAGEPGHLHELVSAARRNGYEPSPNDVYVPGLCRPEIGPGDPQAFVKPSGGTTEIRRKCEDAGVGCEGLITVKRREPDRDPFDKPAGLAPDLIQEEIMDRIAENPDLARDINPRDLIEQVVSECALTPERMVGEASDEAVYSAATYEARDAALATL